MLFRRAAIVYRAKSQYGNYRVVDTIYDGRQARVLYGDDDSAQSGMATDDDPELLFDYNQRFLEILMSKRPKKLLVIGGGAFMLPIAAHRQFFDMIIDVVEIDPALVNISYDYFDLPHDKRMRVHVDDGARFIARTEERYDMIIIDAFSGYSVPPHLFTPDAIEHYQKHLTTDGIVGVNFISEYKAGRPSLAHELVVSFRETFSHTSLYQADTDYAEGEHQNFLLIAGQSPAHFDYLQSNAVESLPMPKAKR